jgi:ribosome recycling factor
MLEDIYKETRDRMPKSVKALEKEMQRVRTGRATTNMLDGVKVDYYGTLTPLNQMASVAIPESRMITIQPWDISAIKEVEKGILKANLGLTPSSDGKIIRINIPPLTEDRRKEIAKAVNNTCEDFKVAVRNIRRDSNDTLKALQKDADISEDENFRAQKEVQEITDDFIKKIEAVFAAKEKEILEL